MLGHMKAAVMLLALTSMAPASAAIRPCPDSEFEKHLDTLRTLKPAVTASEPSAPSLVDFFDALPADFSCFNRLFGYTDTPAPLYAEPELHFLFPKIATVVPKRDFAKKIVSLSIHARWEADQTGALQDTMRTMLDNRTQLTASLLGELSAEDESSVWSFLFSAPHPSDEALSDSVREQVCALSERSCHQSARAYAEAVSNEPIH